MVFTRKWVYLNFSLILLAFVAGIAWAVTRTAEGFAACGIWDLDVKENGFMGVEFFHYGEVTDTREDTAINRSNQNRRHAQFYTGAAFYPDAGGFPFGQHNKQTDVDQATITAQPADKHAWFRSPTYRLMPQATSTFWDWTYISSDVADPSHWWVAGTTYSGYGKDRLEHQIRAVTEWNITVAPTTAHKVNYRKSTHWGNQEKGFWAAWPW